MAPRVPHYSVNLARAVAARPAAASTAAVTRCCWQLSSLTALQRQPRVGISGTDSATFSLPRARTPTTAIPPAYYKHDVPLARWQLQYRRLSTSRLGSELHDVAIVGGGVTGTALLYELSKFTNLKKLVLIERRPTFSMVASAPENNSQTIHCGDIETNYTLEKAKTVKRHADMLRNFATKLPEKERDSAIQRMPKMALAAGDAECDLMERRFQVFKTVFKKMQLIDKKKIAEVEPRVGMKNSYTVRPDRICAIFIENEHSAVNYTHLAASFVDQARSSANTKQIDIQTSTALLDLKHEGDIFCLKTSRGILRARFVVVSACGHSLLLAQRMGYGQEFSCLPVAGSFYFAPEMLNGKVYTCQDPRLPFAAVHGDPDIVAVHKTRFGPTALPLPMLERYNPSTIKDFLEVLNPDLDLIKVYLDLVGTAHMRNYMLRNFLFEVPRLNRTLFAQDVRKIVPSIKSEDLTYAKGFGGVRPQLVDKKKRKLLLGEGKISPGTGIIFNITPSPGGTTCLGNAELDMRVICSKLGATIDEKKFRETLLQGEYPLHE